MRSYGEVLRLQQDLLAARQAGTIPDTLILVEHPDVITLGRSAAPANVLDAGEIPVFAVERGGDVTYHGPGQLVAYPIFLLRDEERDLHHFLRGLEEAVIRTLADFRIEGTRRTGAPGCGPRKKPPRANWHPSALRFVSGSPCTDWRST